MKYTGRVQTTTALNLSYGAEKNEEESRKNCRGAVVLDTMEAASEVRAKGPARHQGGDQRQGEAELDQGF